jgi:hypothetical protein
MADQPPYPIACIVAEKEFALLASRVGHLTEMVEKINEALMGNGKPGVVSELSAIKSHIGFNQPRTLHERMTSIEEFVIEYRRERDEQKSDLKKIVLPIAQQLLTFVLGGLAYILITSVVK